MTPVLARAPVLATTPVLGMSPMSGAGIRLPEQRKDLLHQPVTNRPERERHVGIRARPLVSETRGVHHADRRRPRLRLHIEERPLSRLAPRLSYISPASSVEREESGGDRVALLGAAGRKHR